MQKNKKTDLFRFVTMRSPEVISKERINLGFITHPNEANSYFLADLIGVTDIPAGRTILAGKAGTYTTNNTPQDLKNLDSVFWKFSDWLVKNKGNLNRIAVDANIAAVPTNPIIQEIWDDMLYDVLTKKNPNNRETCLQLIIAINFAQKYTSYSTLGETDEDVLAKEAKELKRLAEGKVILHQSFTKAKDTAYAPTAYGTSPTYKRHEALHTARIASMCAAKLKTVKLDVTKLNETYKKDFKTAYDGALGSYTTQVKQVVDAYIAANPAEVANAKISVDKTIKHIDVSKVNTHEIVKTLTKSETNLEDIIPADLVDQFDFTFNKPLEKQYAQTKLTKGAFGYIKNNLLESESVDTVVKRLDREIDTCEKNAFAVFKKRPKELLVNGVPIKTNNLGIRDFSISFHEVLSEVDGTTSFALYFSVDVGYDNAFIRSGSFTLKIGADTYTTTDFKLESNISETIFGQIFTTGEITVLPDHTIVEFDASFELNNGTNYTIDAEGLTSNTNISGSAVPTLTGITNPDLHYGINTIGVADFRKVEQELCCYVPGEVAHIENVMAREHKDLTTRSLSRIESSTSSEYKRETEESLDTTATSRNEMNSEVAEVIDQESNKNMGFNASVSGEAKKFKFNTGMTSDFSSGKSSSDSNSIARTFAEDITTRAMERITQKISSKRSSKLLKEYEEKNNHTLDNRAGDKHVTGVYRWIDKVYKNRIVNYGKRLIYEFMIPEPSRWYKEALVIKAEETVPKPMLMSNNKEDVLIKPVHPNTLELKNAADITRANYTAFANEYSVEVTAAPEEFSNLSISFGEAIGRGDGLHSFTYEDLATNENYECNYITGKIDCSYHSMLAEHGFIKCGVAGESFGIGFGKDKGWSRKVTIQMNANGIEGPIVVSISCHKTTAFTGSIVAECKLKTTVFEKWQLEVYGQIMGAYEEQMEAYKHAENMAKEEEEQAKLVREQTNAEKPEDTKMVTNSKFNHQRIKTEIKRLCIEMLTKPFGIEMGKNFYQNGKHSIPEVKLGSSLDTYASLVKFFEQAFDWDIMAQKFYPYYWADRADWRTLFQTQDGLDYSYQAFLQSGMGRVIVPVREGFEDAVAYFMETGEVWNGSGIVIDTTDKLYLSIVDETTNIEGVVEGQEWETIVPTSLRILQGKSVFLDEEGLPCCESDPSSTLLPDATILNAQPPILPGA